VAGIGVAAAAQRALRRPPAPSWRARLAGRVG
jgi:hypothetical protein